ncbi:MAG TPA: D-aminoacylase [Gemmatimonadaceae bacterium]|nr:D-aminoacylase [Gemmatimonadaceae bacterium]
MTIPRRDFLRHSALALAGIAAGCAPAVRSSRARWDTLLRGGTVFDGTGAPGVEADVALLDGRVAAVGPRLAGRAALELDARGLAVAPGFIDIHSHADGNLFDDPRAESVVRQGITTVVVGQDGGSRAPAAGDGGREFVSFGGYFGAVERLPSAVNVASMVGLGTVRAAVVGNVDRPATAAELARMEALVRDALAQGACGASSGLEYTPGAFASREELAALCRPLAARRLPYATHMRNEDDHLEEAVEEAIAVARAAGCPLQISHLKTQGARNWGRLDAVLHAIEGARAGGLDVAFDRYPYIAYATTLTNLWPPAALDGGADAFLRRLRDPAGADALRAFALDKVAGLGGWDHVVISAVASDADRAAEGKGMDEWARAAGADPYDAAVALLERSRADVGMVGFGMSEENLERILAHPLGMACTDGGSFAVDGPTRAGHPHPRGLGAFPRVLGLYVRERRALTLEQAIHKLSGFPASRLRLADRGTLRRGSVADVVLFDPATVRDRATFADPFQYPDGIRAVLVNGSLALRDGERSAARTGRVVRAG